MKRRCRTYTLIEVLLVVTMMALIMGSIGWQSHRMIARQHFKSSASAVVYSLELAMAVMLDTGQDVTVHLSPRAVSLKGPIAKKPYSLRCIDHMTWNGDEIDSLDCLFGSHFGDFPRGILTIGYQQWKHSYVLKGFPHRVISGARLDEVIVTTYPREVL